MLRAWLRSRFPHGVELDDLVQEAFARVLRARAAGSAMRSPKAFFFATARNLALDTLRHRQVSGEATLVSFESLDVLDESDGIPETVDRHEKLERLTIAIQSLPARCREVMTLRKVYGLSQKEIAACLGISACTVSAQLTIGVRKEAMQINLNICDNGAGWLNGSYGGGPASKISSSLCDAG
jgi:RNA polymerase sigma-70 factor (ECF subfamily)